jgi:hypothetical protein
MWRGKVVVKGGFAAQINFAVWVILYNFAVLQKRVAFWVRRTDISALLEMG